MTSVFGFVMLGWCAVYSIYRACETSALCKCLRRWSYKAYKGYGELEKEGHTKSTQAA